MSERVNRVHIHGIEFFEWTTKMEVLEETEV